MIYIYITKISTTIKLNLLKIKEVFYSGHISHWNIWTIYTLARGKNKLQL